MHQNCTCVASSRLASSFSPPLRRHTSATRSRSQVHAGLKWIADLTPGKKIRMRLVRRSDLEGTPTPIPFLRLTRAQLKWIVEEEEEGFTVVPLEGLPKNTQEQVDMNYPDLDDVSLEEGGTYIVVGQDKFPPLKSEVAPVLDGTKLKQYKLVQPAVEAFERLRDLF